MTIMRIDADGIAELGASLSEVAHALTKLTSDDAEPHAFSPGETRPALANLLTDWQRARRQLATALDELSQAAATAGAVYYDTEACVAGTFERPAP